MGALGLRVVFSPGPARGRNRPTRVPYSAEDGWVDRLSADWRSLALFATLVSMAELQPARSPSSSRTSKGRRSSSPSWASGTRTPWPSTACRPRGVRPTRRCGGGHAGRCLVLRFRPCLRCSRCGRGGPADADRWADPRSHGHPHGRAAVEGRGLLKGDGRPPGGQDLLRRPRRAGASSATSAQMVEAGLRDLGEHRLKDLGDPVRLY